MYLLYYYPKCIASAAHINHAPTARTCIGSIHFSRPSLIGNTKLYTVYVVEGPVVESRLRGTWP